MEKETIIEKWEKYKQKKEKEENTEKKIKVQAQKVKEKTKRLKAKKKENQMMIAEALKEVTGNENILEDILKEKLGITEIKKNVEEIEDES